MKTYGGLLALALAVALIVFAYCVWPTPYEAVPGFLPGGYLLEPRSHQFGTITGFRRSRLTGRLQARMGGRWYPVSCGFGCTVDDPPPGG